MTVVSPWHGKQGGIEHMLPDMTVWTIRANHPDPSDIWYDCDGNLCDTAWTKRQEVYHHHWFEKGKPPPHIIKTTLLEYLKMHFAEIQGMNPFWDVGRMEFLDRWTTVHGHWMEISTAGKVRIYG